MIRAITTAAAFLLTLTAPALPQSPEQDEPAPGSVHLESEIVEIEIDLATGRPTAKLLVNGRGPYDFVVDTGAALSVIDDAIATELGLEVVGRQTLRSPGASEGIEGRRVRIDSVEMGGLRIDEPVFATMDIVAFSTGLIEGVLGRSHFRDLLMTFDYPGSRLLIQQGELDPEDAATMAFDSSAGSIQFLADVAGVSLPMVLDTGSPGGFTLPKNLEEELSFASPLGPGPTIHLVGGVHETWRGELTGTIRLGGLRWEGPTVTLTTMHEDRGNLGFQVLRDLRCTLDFRNSRLRFERAAQSEPETRSAVIVGGRRPAPAAGGQPRLGVAFRMSLGGFEKQDGGLVVQYVEAGSPAELAGLRLGDVVLSAGGRPLAPIESSMEIGTLLRGPRPLILSVLRGGDEVELAVP